MIPKLSKHWPHITNDGVKYIMPKHHGHFRSLKRASEVITGRFGYAVVEANRIYKGLPVVKIDICSENCPMFRDGRCDALGIKKAPIGKNCKAQEISQGVER